jgi:MFS family permease
MFSAVAIRLLGPAMAYKAYRAYWLGTLASVAGFQMLTFSQYVIIHRLTHDPKYLAWVALASAVPAIVLNIYGGVLADKLERRRLIAVTQIINGFLILILTILTFAEIVQPIHVIMLAFLSGAVNAFDQPARQALFPSLINPKVMMNAVALNSAIWTGIRIIAPAFAGFIIALAGEGVSFLLSALGFFTMAVVVLTLHVPVVDNSLPGRPTGGWGSSRSRGGPLEGLKFIAANNAFVFLIGMSFFNSFFGMAYIPMMPVFAEEILKVGVEGQGILMGLGGVGALAMTMTLGRMGNIKQRGFLIIIGAFMFGLLLATFSISAQFVGNYYLAMVLMFIMGMSSSVYMISIMSSLQLMVPDDMRGRVMGFYSMTYSIMPLGGLYAAAAAGLFGGGSKGVPPAVALGGLFVALFAIGPALLNRNVRNVGILVQDFQSDDSSKTVSSASD